jgi:hypothetical protein
MPYIIVKNGDGRFGVRNAVSGVFHSYHTTLAKAKAQMRLLQAIDHGFVPTKKYQ